MATLEQIKAVIDRASEIGPIISDEARETPKIHAKLLWLRLAEKNELQTLERELERVYLARWMVYSGKATPEQLKTEPHASLRILKTDMDIFMSADSTLQALVSKIELSKQKNALIEEGIKMCNSRQFLLKTMLDAKRFEAGLN